MLEFYQPSGIVSVAAMFLVAARVEVGTPDPSECAVANALSFSAR